MEPGTTFPLDIFLYIIDLSAGGDDKDTKSFRILSQTCKYMVPPCRKHFLSLRLRSRLDSECFSDLLSKNQCIARCARSLPVYYSVYNPITDHESNILDMLKESSSLQLIELLLPRLDWNFPESIRSSRVSLVQLLSHPPRHPHLSGNSALTM